MENSAEDLGEIVNNMSLEELAVSIRQLAAMHSDTAGAELPAVPLHKAAPPFDLVCCGGRHSLPGVVLQMEILPEATVGSIGDLVALVPSLVDAYQQLRHRLLAGHCLTVFQQMEKLLQVQPLGGQHPTELLAYMMQLYPDAERVTRLFRILFFSASPRI
jgi:hypothetical protein